MKRKSDAEVFILHDSASPKKERLLPMIMSLERYAREEFTGAQDAGIYTKYCRLFFALHAHMGRDTTCSFSGKVRIRETHPPDTTRLATGPAALLNCWRPLSVQRRGKRT